jgi:hypothetical protein
MHGIDIKDKILGFTQKQLFLNPAVRYKLAKKQNFCFSTIALSAIFLSSTFSYYL